MKPGNKLKAALLASEPTGTVYQVRVSMSNGRWATLQFSEKAWAQNEYNRIKAAGIYCDSWITACELEEKVL